MILSQIRSRIRKCREKRGLRAQDLAERMGISRPYYTQLGDRCLPLQHHAIRVSVVIRSF